MSSNHKFRSAGVDGANRLVEAILASKMKRHLLRYALSVSLVASGLLLRWALTAQVGESLPTYVTFYPAVVLAALFAGLGPGIVATLLSVVVVDYWVVSPRELFITGSTAEIAGVVTFSVMGMMLTVLTDRHRRTRAKIEGYQKELEDFSGALEAQQLTSHERDFVSAVLEKVGALVMVLDHQGRIKRFNRECEQISGYSFEEVRDRVFWEFLVSDRELDLVKEAFGQLKAGQLSVQHENDWIIKSGEHRRILWSNTCLLDGNGHLRFVIATGIDLTQQGLAEYRNALERHELALEAGDLGTWSYDFAKLEFCLDERCRAMLGPVQEDKISFEQGLQLIHKDDRAEVSQALTTALAGESGGTFACELRLTSSDHVAKWISARGQVYFQGEGAGRKPVRFMGTIRDISERRQTEETLAFLAHRGATAGENFFQSLARFLAEILGMDYVCIDRLGTEDSTATTVAVFQDGSFQDNYTYDLRDTPCGKVARQAICSIPSNVRELFPNDAALQEMKAESYAGITLVGHAGETIGLIAVIARRPLSNLRHIESLLRLVAGRAAGELERQQAMEALRVNEERLLLAQRAGHLGVFDVDFKTRKWFWSDERKAQFGVPPEFEATDDSWPPLVLAEDYEASTKELQRALSARRRNVEWSFRVNRPNGEMRWLQDTALIVYDDSGEPVRMSGTSADITKDVQARERARRRQHEFRISAIRLVIILMLSLFLAEASIMVVLVRMPSIGPGWGVVLDSTLLVLLVSPVMYYFAFRPLVAILEQRERIEEDLHSAYQTLEARVADRTASLGLANQRLESEVAERKKAEAEVRRARDEWERTFDSVPDLIAILDKQYRVVRANRAMTERLGLAPGEVLGKACYDLVHGMGCPVAGCPHTRTLVDGKEHSCELNEPRLGGDFLVTTTPLADESGQQIGTVHVARDITARRRTEDALKRSQEDLNHAQAVAHVGSWRLNIKRNELVWSEENCRIFGIPKGTPLTYETFLAAVHPEDRALVDRKWQAAMNGATYDLEHRILVDGEEKWIRERAELEFDRQGVLLGGFGTSQDITERKQAEAALAHAHAGLELKVQERTARLAQIVRRLREEIRVRRETERRIQEAGLRYQTVANFTHDWEYWKAPDGRLLYCSPSCERVSGYTPEELIADPRMLHRMIVEEDIPIWDEHENNAIQNPGFREIQFRIRKKSGEIRWIDHTCRCVAGDNGEFLGIRASNRDVTERKKEEMETQLLREELGRFSRVAVAGQLAAAIAHELNQPLGAVLCNARAISSLMALEPPDLNEMREALVDIEADCRRAGAVIQRLRSLYQKGQRTAVMFQINELIRETVELVHSEFVFKAVNVQLELEPSLPPVEGNPIEFQQVILNLVMNAVEAMAGSAPTSRRLKLRSWIERGKDIRVSIADSGPGIPPAELERIFEPFHTTKPGGMGMGLAISQSIMEQHGGRIWAENNPDAGACFTITLPSNQGKPA